MKRLFILLAATFVASFVFGQDTVTVRHKYYTTTYSKSLKYPVKVEWWITRESLVCPIKVKRVDKFVPDPVISKETDVEKHYHGSSYDRGHNFPAADGGCSKESMEQSFYFSNMTPQTPELNRGDWKNLEIWCRTQAIEHDSIKVWSGSVGSVKQFGDLDVPKICWKVIYVKRMNKYYAYVFNNDNTKPDGFENNQVELSKVESITGFKFKL